MAKPARDPFEVRLTPEQRETFTHWLCDELDAARAAQLNERTVDYWHILYEQARTRSAATAPWPNSADLTSYLGTQNVDALHARLMKTVWVEPVWTVEGWGPSAQNAPYVEEAHQWWAEEEGLQGVLDRLSQISLIEPRGLLEVREGTETRMVRKQMKVALALDPQTQAPVFGLDAKPVLQQDDAGFIAPQSPQQAYVEAVVDVPERVRTGPLYRILPYRDSLILPGHARDDDDIWGYAKRLRKRIPEIKRAAKDGLYDQEEVDRLTHTGDTEPDAALQRSGTTIAAQDGPTAEKELWEVLVLCDPDDSSGERWYLATVHLGQQALLRLQYDDLDRSRFVLVNLFPRPGRATEGFSFIGHKLITTIEEHTAWRNMTADRAAMAVQAPIKRMTGALWDPLEQPWGPSAVIDVRDHREVEPVQVPDIPAGAMELMQQCERTAERIAGVNDIASGQFAQESKTLGEIQMATEQSFVRMDLVIRRFQEAMEDLFQIRHAIYKRSLAEAPDGVSLPDGSLIGLESRGLQLPGGKLTAELFEGEFRGKPRGSVETADPRANRADFSQAMQALPSVFQLMPMIAQINPAAPRALLAEFARVYRWANKQALLGPPGQPPMPGMMGPQPLPMPGGPPPQGPPQAPPV